MPVEVLFGGLVLILIAVLVFVIRKNAEKQSLEQLEDPIFNSFEKEQTKKDPETEFDPVDVLSTPDFLEDDVKPRKKRATKAAKKITPKKPRKKS